MAVAEFRDRAIVPGVAALALSALLAGCSTSADRWRALSREGPLARWAACMESDGYRAYEEAAIGQGRAVEDGATPITWTAMFLLAVAECEALAEQAGIVLTPLNRSQLYLDTERMLQRKLAKSSGLE